MDNTWPIFTFIILQTLTCPFPPWQLNSIDPQLRCRTPNPISRILYSSISRGQEKRDQNCVRLFEFIGRLAFSIVWIIIPWFGHCRRGNFQYKYDDKNYVVTLFISGLCILANVKQKMNTGIRFFNSVKRR